MITSLFRRFCTQKVLNNYGQGGVLQIASLSPNQVSLVTTWQDHTEVSLPSAEYLVGEEDARVFRLEEKSLGPSHRLECFIPEYYGLDLSLAGDLTYRQENVDSKLYGDVTIATRGNIHLNKAKA